MNNIILGYIGLFFAMTYRIPQIKKIYKNKKGDDISKKTCLIHNLSYIFLFFYLFNKDPYDYLILLYYIIGLLQNLLIISLKIYYKNKFNNINV